MNSRVCSFNRHSTGRDAFTLHRHEYYEIVYFLSGKGTAVINGAEYPFYPNSFCVVRPHSPHTERIDGTGEIVFMGFSYDDDAYPIKEGMYHCNGMYVHSIISDIIRESAERKKGFEVIQSAKLNEMIIRIARINERGRSDDTPFQNAIGYIRENYNRTIDFRRVAQLNGYSYDYFRHKFRRLYSLSPQAYVLNYRLEKASGLLTETELNCTEVGYACGFSDSAQFSRMFKEKFGVPPSQYLKSTRNTQK